MTLNYFEKAAADMKSAHNLEGMRSNKVEYVIIDNLDVQTIRDIPEQKKLRSVDGIESIAGREVLPLMDLNNADVLENAIFLQMNNQAIGYLRKILTAGVKTTALYKVVEDDVLKDQFRRSQIRSAAVPKRERAHGKQAVVSVSPTPS